MNWKKLFIGTLVGFILMVSVNIFAMVQFDEVANIAEKAIAGCQSSLQVISRQNDLLRQANERIFELQRIIDKYESHELSPQEATEAR